MQKGKENVIDRTTQQLMKMPAFTPITLPEPLTLQPISIKPLPPMVVDPGLMLSPQVLLKLGVKESQNPGFFSGLLNCGAACKALSKQTAAEIIPTNNLQEEIPSKDHLNDQQRRQSYQKQWKQIKKQSVKVPRMSFQKFYETKGNLQSEQWKKVVGDLFQ